MHGHLNVNQNEVLLGVKRKYGVSNYRLPNHRDLLPVYYVLSLALPWTPYTIILATQ